MRFASLGSGSRGNATLIHYQSTLLMVDLGFSIRETERRLARLDCHPSQIDAILVTHEHSDHVQGVAKFANKYCLPVWASHGTWRSKKLAAFNAVAKNGTGNLVNYINCHAEFTIGDILVQPFPVPHDAEEPCQFVFEAGHLRLGLLTDTGSLTPHIERMLSKLDALLLECNHDISMLQQGQYPEMLKRRVGGDYGHLSNDQAMELLARIETKNLQSLVIMHLSAQNNDDNLVFNTLLNVVPDMASIIEVADQDQGLAWRQLKKRELEINKIATNDYVSDRT